MYNIARTSVNLKAFSNAIFHYDYPIALPVSSAKTAELQDLHDKCQAPRALSTSVLIAPPRHGLNCHTCAHNLFISYFIILTSGAHTAVLAEAPSVDGQA